MAIQKDFGSYFSKMSSSKLPTKKDKEPDWILNIKRALDNQKKLKEQLKESEKDKEEMMNKIDKSINDLELKYKKAQLSYKEWRMKQDFE